MTYVAPTTHVAGETLPAADWNVIANNEIALYESIQRIGYTERTTNYSVASATVAAAANIFTTGITWTADGTSKYRIEFYCPFGECAVNVNSAVQVAVTNGSTNIATLSYVGSGTGSVQVQSPIHAVFYYAPSAGSITINARGFYSAAAGVLYGGTGSASVAPMFLAVFGPPTA